MSKTFTAKYIALTAMLTALVIATSFIPPIPVPPAGNIYWCDTMIFVAAFLVSPVQALIAGGVGTMLYDIIVGHSYMMLISLVVHGLQGYAVAAILKILKFKHEEISAAIAAFVGAVIVILGYFAARTLVQGNAIFYAVLRMPANVMQECVGVVGAMIICYGLRLKSQLKKSHLLPERPLKFSTEKNCLVEQPEITSAKQSVDLKQK